MVKKIFKWSVRAALVAFLLLQFFRPARTNPPVEQGSDLFDANPPPPPVAALLRGACYDCHSHETQWPWYSNIAPVSFWLVDHVNEGRERMDFSEWPHDRAKRVRKNWENIADEIRSGRMPMTSYKIMHSAGRLSAAQRETLAGWAEAEAARLKIIEAAADK
jgi:hypothetical protein